MDPNAVLLAFLTAVDECDLLGAQDAADLLTGWLGMGGFEPNWLPEEKDAFLMFAAGGQVLAN